MRFYYNFGLLDIDELLKRNKKKSSSWLTRILRSPLIFMASEKQP